MIEVERLHAKVSSMSKRIRQLEKALATSHIASTSVEPHPLLLSSSLEDESDSSDDSHSQVDSTGEGSREKEADEALVDNSIMESFRKLTISSSKDSDENVFDMSEVSLFDFSHEYEVNYIDMNE